jgi:hypothetical protein
MIFDVGFSIHDAKILIDVESDAENVLNVSENNPSFGPDKLFASMQNECESGCIIEKVVCTVDRKDRKLVERCKFLIKALNVSRVIVHKSTSVIVFTSRTIKSGIVSTTTII